MAELLVRLRERNPTYAWCYEHRADPDALGTALAGAHDDAIYASWLRRRHRNEFGGLIVYRQARIVCRWIKNLHESQATRGPAGTYGPAPWVTVARLIVRSNRMVLDAVADEG